MRSGRHICSDSYFSSFQIAKAFYKNGLRFAGVVKTATNKFSMNYLSTRELSQEGGSHFTTKIKSNEGETLKILALAWVNRNKRYFISTTGTINPDRSHERIRGYELKSKILLTNIFQFMHQKL